MNDSEWAALIRDLKDHDDIDASLHAAERLHRDAAAADIPRLKALLLDESFYVREAVAWPLSALAGAAALPELLEAYQRGFDEGNDNDGFSALLMDMAATHPNGLRPVLDALAASGIAPLERNARWLLEFCDGPGGA